METMRPINDVLDVDALQRMQDNFSKATNMSFITVDYKGNPITKASGFTEFCNLCREIPEMARRCYQCDAHGGLHSAITGRPHIYKCHAGLIDFAIPLIYEENYYGALMGGQINSNSPEGQLLDRIIEKASYWPEKTSLSEAYNRTEVIPLEKIQAVVDILHDNVNQILAGKHFKKINASLEEKEEELTKERVKSIELQRLLDEELKKNTFQQISISTIFSGLNLLSREAYIEQASVTEKAVYSFANILRYTFSKRDNPLSTLEDELNYIDNYLQLQKLRFMNKLSFNIDARNSYNSCLCPFMLFHTIIDSSLEHLTPGRTGDINIAINIKENANEVEAAIIIYPLEFTEEQKKYVLSDSSDSLVNPPLKKLKELNKTLNLLLGAEHSLKLETFQENRTLIKVTLPNKNN